MLNMASDNQISLQMTRSVLFDSETELPKISFFKSLPSIPIKCSTELTLEERMDWCKLVENVKRGWAESVIRALFICFSPLFLILNNRLNLALGAWHSVDDRNTMRLSCPTYLGVNIINKADRSNLTALGDFIWKIYDFSKILFSKWHLLKISYRF